jgi:hypothetical protein
MTQRSLPTVIERPPAFIFREQRKSLFRRGGDFALHCEEIPLSKLAKRFGTPLYVYSTTAIRERLATFQDAFRQVSNTICYSVKANSNINILRLLAREGCGFDVVSGGELERVLVADRRAAKKTVFSGVGKSRDGCARRRAWRCESILTLPPILIPTFPQACGSTSSGCPSAMRASFMRRLRGQDI